MIFYSAINFSNCSYKCGTITRDKHLLLSSDHMYFHNIGIGPTETSIPNSSVLLSVAVLILSYFYEHCIANALLGI